jgi:cell division protein ZipA
VDIKSWILIGGGLLLIAVIGHGFWLAWRNRRNALRLEIDPNVPQDDIDPLELLRGELPNGGARVRPAGSSAQQHELVFPNDTSGAVEAAAADAGLARTSANAALTARASDRIGTGRSVHAGSRATPQRPGREQTPADVAQPVTSAAADAGSERIAADRRPPSTASGVRAKRAERAPAAASPTAPKPAVPEEVIVINVLARHGARFHGSALMEAFMRNALKFGDMNIFHRMDPSTRTPQFSLASAVEPGTFDLSAMDDFETLGVCLFMPLPGPADPLPVFEDMLNVARDIAGALGGDLKDEGHSVMTAQNIQHCRQRIAEFTRRQLSRP